MTRTKTVMTANGPDSYVSADGQTMKREYGMLSDGYQLSGQWVLRDNMGLYIDRDTYRNDLAERNLSVLS